MLVRKMNTPRRLITYLYVALACTAAVPCRAEKRPPTATERTMLNNFRDVIHRFLDLFGNDDWERDVTSEYDMDDDIMVSSDPDVPLDVDQLIQRTYRVRAGSDYYNRVYAPSIEKMQATEDVNEKIRLGKQLEPMEVTVMVHFNRAFASFDADPSGREKLAVAGPTMAWRSRSDRKASVTLLYGDWTSATQTGDGLKYRFKRKGRYPAIENIVIEISGAPSRIDEQLRNLDWKQPNGALAQAQ